MRSRPVDGLERAGLVDRRRDGPDRRVVRVRATPKSLRLLDRIEGDLLAIHQRQLGHMSASELGELTRLLDRARRPRTGAAT